MSRLHLTAGLSLVALALSGHGADLNQTIVNALEVSAERASYLTNNVLVSPTVYTDYTNTNGVWIKRTRSTWTSGFVPGIFWYLHDHTGDPVWLGRAQQWTEGVRLRATEPDNDTGFQIFCSFGLGYTLNGAADADYFGVMTTAANTFDTQRFNPEIGCFRSWTNTSANPVTNPSTTDSTTNPYTMVFEVNIDEMMNLELPLFIGLNGGSTTLVDHVIAHADRTWDVLVRPNGSTFHVAGFNLDGSVQYRRTHQGWRTDSTWSRGQAWATYGYAMVYRYTGLERMLQRAEACFDYFVAATAAQSSDGVPYSDFDAALNSLNPKDSSAAAIVASAAVDLYRMTGVQKYRDAAEAMLLVLGGTDYLGQGTTYQPVLRRGSQKWGTAEVGTIFGDYYFLEGMLRYVDVIGLGPLPDTGAGRLANISTRGEVGTGDSILIAGFVIEASSKHVLLRGIGPGLAAHGVTNPVADPVLRLYNQASPDTPMAENDDWGSQPDAAAIAQATLRAGAFGLDAGSADAAMLLWLQPGIYTLHLSAKTPGSAQIGLVEVYNVPPETGP